MKYNSNVLALQHDFTLVYLLLSLRQWKDVVSIPEWVTKLSVGFYLYTWKIERFSKILPKILDSYCSGFLVLEVEAEGWRNPSANALNNQLLKELALWYMFKVKTTVLKGSNNKYKNPREYSWWCGMFFWNFLCKILTPKFLRFKRKIALLLSSM